MSVHNWFECSAKYIQIDESGREAKVTESYMIDAISHTEAETRFCKELETMVQGAFIVKTIKPSNITEIIPSDDESDDRWYKAKVLLIDADELTGKEKKSAVYYLVEARDLRKALCNLELSLASYIIPYEIASLADTKFMDVFPYFKGDEEEISEGLVPIEEFENKEEELG